MLEVFCDVCLVCRKFEFKRKSSLNLPRSEGDVAAPIPSALPAVPTSAPPSLPAFPSMSADHRVSPLSSVSPSRRMRRPVSSLSLTGKVASRADASVRVARSLPTVAPNQQSTWTSNSKVVSHVRWKTSAFMCSNMV